MPLPLLIPAAVAVSSQVSLLTLFSSITAALTSGFALGTQLSQSSDKASDDNSFSSIMEQFKMLPEQTTYFLKKSLGDFGEDSAQLAESTKQLSLLGAQLTDAAQTTKMNTQRLFNEVQEPLIRVGTTLTTSQKKTDEVTVRLKKTQ